MLTPSQINGPGRRVGDYTLIKRLGEGGMGTVWLAEHAMLGRRAAIKLLHEAFASRADTVTRFFNEARAASAIPDHGIVQIFDFGRDAAGTVYLVMELLEGEPLDERLRRNGPFAIEGALRLVRQVASSLGAAHARGIVHRDLKPENIFIVRDLEVAGGERTKVLDFGIAKLTDPAGMKTQTSTLMGTPTFMSPEQCRGAGNVDQRSDIYSLGCVLFVLLTGRPPFDAEGPGDVIAMHLREPAPLLSSIHGATPRELDELVARCLAKDPKQRFANGLALAAAIEALLAAHTELRPMRTDLSSPMRATASGVSASGISASGIAARGVAETMMKRPTTLSSGAAELAVAPPTRTRTRWIGALVVASALVGLGVMTARHDSASVVVEPATMPAHVKTGIPDTAGELSDAAPDAVPGAAPKLVPADPVVAPDAASMPDAAPKLAPKRAPDAASVPVADPVVTPDAASVPVPASPVVVPPSPPAKRHRSARPPTPTEAPPLPKPKKPKCDLDGDGVPDDWSCS